MKLNSNREKRDTSKLRMVATKSDKANRQKRSAAPMMRVSKQLKGPRMLEKSVELKNTPMVQLQMGGNEASLASSNSASSSSNTQE